MAASSNIWQLIQSLTQQEKLFFRRDFSRSTGNGQEPLYLQLFDLLNKQQEYDEVKLIQQLSPALNAKNISYTKNYLTEQLFKALLVLHAAKDIDAGLYQQLSLVRILRNKNLHKMALKIWQSSLKQARRYENYAMIQLLKEEYRKLQLYYNPKATQQDLLNDYDEAIISVEEYAKLLQMQELHFQALLLRRKAHFRQTKEDQGTIKNILQQSILDAPIVNRSFLYKHYYHMTKATLHYLQHNAESYVHAYVNIHNWQAEPDRIGYDPENYIEVLYVFYYTAVLAKDYQHVIDVMEHPANKRINGASHIAYFEAIKHLALNRIYNKLADYYKVEALVKGMKKMMPQWEQYVNEDIQRTLNLSLGIACFVLRDYDDAYHYIKNALLLFDNNSRTEHYSFAHLFLLVICFEKKDNYLFELQYKSTYSYFYRHETPLPFEKAIIHALNKAYHTGNFKGLQQQFNQLSDTLKLTGNDPVQQQVFTIFNFPVWIESKLNRVPYKEWVVRKVKEGLQESKTAS